MTVPPEDMCISNCIFFRDCCGFLRTESNQRWGGRIAQRDHYFPEDEWIYSWLLSFGDEVKEIRPVHV